MLASSSAIYVEQNKGNKKKQKKKKKATSAILPHSDTFLFRLLSFLFPPSPCIGPYLCSVSTTVSEVTTLLRLAVHLQPWQRLVSLCLPLLLPLSSNQTCNYSVGQSGPRWHAVKYDHQFGPYPFITVSPLLSWDGWCYSSAPLSPNVGHFPYTGLTHTHGSPHLSQLPCGRASKWGISPSTIYQ